MKMKSIKRCMYSKHTHHDLDKTLGWLCTQLEAIDDRPGAQLVHCVMVQYKQRAGNGQ